MASSAKSDSFRCCATMTWLLSGCALLAVTGCSRHWYLTRADEDAYEILGEKTRGTRLAPPPQFDINPPPESRLHDATPAVDPLLPSPVPTLYPYAIPEGVGTTPEYLIDLPEPTPDESAQAFTQPNVLRSRKIVLAHLQADEEAAREEIASIDEGEDVPPMPVPDSAFGSIPLFCRLRMYEFESVREEYRRTYNRDPLPSERDAARRLDFEDIMRLAVLNSREFQTARETLYRVALRLTRERYEYELNPAPLGNAIGLFGNNTRSNGATSEGLAVPGRAQFQRMLRTGTNLVLGFANDVVLTFDGANGFASDVSTSMLFELSHSLFQNDVRFENLTQAERNVLYAARDFLRFRRQFYSQVAGRYYTLLRQYRDVEIESQNYLSLVRVHNERLIEYDLDRISRVQVDQVEQNALNGRGSLISICTTLETSLDQLKLLIGLPPETSINLDLSELEELTRRDEVGVAEELVRRSRERLQFDRSRLEENETEYRVLQSAIDLINRILESLEAKDRLAATEDRSNPLPEFDLKAEAGQHLRLRETLAFIEQELLVRDAFEDLSAARRKEEATPLEILELSLQYAQAVDRFLRQAERLLQERNQEESTSDEIRLRRESLLEQKKRLEDELQVRLDELRVDELGALIPQAEALVNEHSRAIQQARDLAGVETDPTDREATRRRILELIDGLLKTATNDQKKTRPPLAPIETTVDDAMLAALVRRYDLMNTRGQLADDWRRVKLAADDLRSILNLQARQSLGTGGPGHRFANFGINGNRTELSATLDTPLNRRNQRNEFREQLLDFQVSRRGLMAVEDTIKRDVRLSLRTLDFSREQYVVGVASAALAYERASSTQRQLRLGVGNVTSRDFLEAQNAYASALSIVARRHFDYITSRIDFFRTLELLELTSDGMWEPLHDESRQPPIDEPNLEEWEKPWGDLPDVMYSDKVLRMLEGS